MIKGIGIDLIELDRIKQSIKRNPRFVQRILTKEERNYYERLNDRRQIEFLAGRFAAKEAFAKAAGTGIGTISFQDIEVLPDQKGAPHIKVSSYSELSIWVAITHSEQYAVAQVILEER
ncbi:holo-ACP synthase [Halobacillus sp. A5]|uniref:holo-ACP synthase n=1 Tax=Halobacillus sp. A5 TaxID=2880263 RepID=UPI0020A67CFF|nr:holo-ACP synthase [Halobacillus sp. A5]MCP3029245.1 holo-ACP synthase [Halobacillus sp. A5]